MVHKIRNCEQEDSVRRSKHPKIAKFQLYAQFWLLKNRGMSPTLNIRIATPDDAQALLDLYQHLTKDAEPCPLSKAKDTLKMLSNYPGSAVLLGKLGATPVSSRTLIIVPNLTRWGCLLWGDRECGHT